MYWRHPVSPVSTLWLCAPHTHFITDEARHEIPVIEARLRRGAISGED